LRGPKALDHINDFIKKIELSTSTNGAFCLLRRRYINWVLGNINGKLQGWGKSDWKAIQAKQIVVYNRDFELPLPGDLPETIEGSEHGQVYYKLKAVAERPTFSMNFGDKRPVQVLRYMLPSALELSQSLLIANEWADKMSYEISVPCKVYSGADVIPITFDLIPIAQELKARYITCTLKEYCTYTAGDNVKSESRIVKFLRDDEFPSTGDRWTKIELLRIPQIGTNIHCDAETDLIKIKHKLKFTVSLINLDGHISGKFF
jgi:hypothetical protein